MADSDSDFGIVAATVVAVVVAIASLRLACWLLPSAARLWPLLPSPIFAHFKFFLYRYCFFWKVTQV